MNIAEMRKEPTVETSRPVAIDMKLEVIVIPVSDVDRAKRFYGDLGLVSTSTTRPATASE
jgi:hypothetical protein